MKKLIIPTVLVALIGLAACTKPAEPIVDTVGEQNKLLVQNYIAAAVKGDTSALDGFLADGYKTYGPAVKDSLTKAEDIANWKMNWKKNWSSVDYSRAGTIAFTIPAGEKFPGDWVSDWGLVTIASKNGMPTVSFWWNGVYRVKDGKIEISRAIYDLNDILVQQGFKIVPPEPAAK